MVWSGYSWKATLPAGSAPVTFSVRAFDKTGNLSASSAPATFG